MARQEERHQAAIKEFPHFAERRVGFIAGAEWADEHPINYDGKAMLHVLNKSAEQAKKQTIEKACKWLQKNADTYIGVEELAILQDAFFEDFRKAMEE